MFYLQLSLLFLLFIYSLSSSSSPSFVRVFNTQNTDFNPATLELPNGDIMLAERIGSNVGIFYLDNKGQVQWTKQMGNNIQKNP